MGEQKKSRLFLLVLFGLALFFACAVVAWLYLTHGSDSSQGNVIASISLDMMVGALVAAGFEGGFIILISAWQKGRRAKRQAGSLGIVAKLEKHVGVLQGDLIALRAHLERQP